MTHCVHEFARMCVRCGPRQLRGAHDRHGAGDRSRAKPPMPKPRVPPMANWAALCTHLRCSPGVCGPSGRGGFGPSGGGFGPSGGGCGGLATAAATGGAASTDSPTPCGARSRSYGSARLPTCRTQAGMAQLATTCTVQCATCNSAAHCVLRDGHTGGTDWTARANPSSMN
jgi:hypothetical protein